MSELDVIIVGAGLAGLSCARSLIDQGASCAVLEESDDVGGRVKTDQVSGFLLDHGFQVLLTSYPEAKRCLNYEELDLQMFEPGALVRFQDKFHRFVDPWRRPKHLVTTATSPVASLGDKLRVAALRNRVKKQSLASLFERQEVPTLERLQGAGFSERIIERFFRPFLSGVFLEPNLSTSSRKFEFVFRMFSEGDAVLPAAGMQAIPRQLAAALPPSAIRTRTRVESVSKSRVALADGEVLEARAVVVAVEQPAAAKILDGMNGVKSNQVACLYFAADRAPVQEPILVLNGEGHGPINNLCVPSQVAPSYAPSGRALISVSVLNNNMTDGPRLIASVQKQLVEWFGSEAKGWEHLRSYVIQHALPSQTTLDPAEKQARREDGIFVCGDYLDAASIQGAMAAGRRAAEAVLTTL